MQICYPLGGLPNQICAVFEGLLHCWVCCCCSNCRSAQTHSGQRGEEKPRVRNVVHSSDAI